MNEDNGTAPPIIRRAPGEPPTPDNTPAPVDAPPAAAPPAKPEAPKASDKPVGPQ